MWTMLPALWDPITRERTIQYLRRLTHIRIIELTVADPVSKVIVRLVAGLSPRRPGFASGSVHVGFVMYKVALEKVFLRVLRVFPCQYHSTVALHTHVSSGWQKICLLVAAVQRPILILSTWTTKWSSAWSMHLLFLLTFIGHGIEPKV
jgi:hypothetical protein